MENIDELFIKRRKLKIELETIDRQIEDAQTEYYRHLAGEKMLVKRYFSGERIIFSFGRHWWVSPDGDLLGLVEGSDIDELSNLVKKGVFEKINIDNV